MFLSSRGGRARAAAALLLRALCLAARQRGLHPDLVRPRWLAEAQAGARGDRASADRDRADPPRRRTRRAARDLRASAPRVYADARAPARTRRGDFLRRASEIATGYADRWLIDLTTRHGRRTARKRADSLLAPGARTPARSGPCAGGGAGQVFPYGWLDAGALVSPTASVCRWAFVRARKGHSAADADCRGGRGRFVLERQRSRTA
jgi:hypothetical protein